VILAVINKIVDRLVEPKQAEFDLISQSELAQARAKDQEFLKDQEKKKETFIKQINEDVAQYTKELNQYKSTLKSHIASIDENNILSSNDKNISAVSFILYQLKTGRADSIKEALQRYDDKRRIDSMRELDRLEREWARQDAQKAAEEKAEQDRRDREAQIRRQEKIDRENEELRKRINKALDDIEDR
jgi:biopolymer transport protein ExbB/TolQ